MFTSSLYSSIFLSTPQHVAGLLLSLYMLLISHLPNIIVYLYYFFYFLRILLYNNNKYYYVSKINPVPNCLFMYPLVTNSDTEASTYSLFFIYHITIVPIKKKKKKSSFEKDVEIKSLK